MDASYDTLKTGEAFVAGRPGRPPDVAGQRRKQAMVSAWEVFSSLNAAVVAARAKITTTALWAIVDPKRQHLASAKVLRTTAVLFRDHASRLTAEADRLERVAEETER